MEQQVAVVLCLFLIFFLFKIKNKNSIAFQMPNNMTVLHNHMMDTYAAIRKHDLEEKYTYDIWNEESMILNCIQTLPILFHAYQKEKERKEKDKEKNSTRLLIMVIFDWWGYVYFFL